MNYEYDRSTDLKIKRLKCFTYANFVLNLVIIGGIVACFIFCKCCGLSLNFSQIHPKKDDCDESIKAIQQLDKRPTHSSVKSVVQFSSSMSDHDAVIGWTLNENHRDSFGKFYKTNKIDNSRTITVPFDGHYIIIADLNFDPTIIVDTRSCETRQFIRPCIVIINSAESPVCHRLKIPSCIAQNTVIASIVYMKAGQGIRVEGDGFQSFYEATLQISYTGSFKIL